MKSIIDDHEKTEGENMKSIQAYENTQMHNVIFKQTENFQ